MRNLLIILLFSSFAAAQAQCDFIIPASTFIIDGSNGDYPPGSVICLEAGPRDYLIIRNIVGTPQAPVIIQNTGGFVYIATSHYYGVKISGCAYMQLSGAGSEEYDYGIQIMRVDNGAGVSVTDLSTDIEINNLEVANTAMGGIYAKTDPDCNFNSTRDKFTMYNFRLHDCYLHDILDEGLYIGSSKYTGQPFNCNGKDTILLPHLMVGTRIYDNIVVNTGWDGIQVSSSPTDCQIYDNEVWFDSYRETTDQMSGILIGGGSSCDCFNNTVTDGKGDGIDVLGLGNMKIYNNLIVNAGRTFQPLDPNAFKHGIYIGNVVTTAGATMGIYNNTIVSPKSDGVKFFNDVLSQAWFYNNLITEPGRLAQEGDQAYINGTQVSIIKSNNLFYSSTGYAGFIGTGDDNYDLKPNSPAVNTGKNLNAQGIYDDILGRERPFHTYFDVGAYECHDPNADIDEITISNKIVFFPNPARDEIKIPMEKLDGDILKVNILNNNGQLVGNYPSPDKTDGACIMLDTSILPSGYYILEIITTRTTYRNSVLLN